MKAVELFAGAGGLGMGVSQAGFVPKAVIERDKYCCETLRSNQSRGLEVLKDWPLFECDIRDFDIGSIRDSIDLLSAGPPCQPFSIGGNHRAYLDARDLFPDTIRAVRLLRPKAFLIENVRGLVRRTFANYFEYICLQLAYPELKKSDAESWGDHHSRLQKHHTAGSIDGLRYQVLWRVLNAADYGLPQRRERVFLVGFRADLAVNWSFPNPTHSREGLLWSQWASGDYWENHGIAQPESIQDSRARATVSKLICKPDLLPWLTVRDGLRDLPDPEHCPEQAAGIECHKLQAGARIYPGHTGSPLDEPAKTLKAGDHGVPGGENMLRRLDGSARYFSVREASRLQGFPDEYSFDGSWTEAMRQLGNAVPVDVSKIIATSIRERLQNT